jgi:hypothetical protein
LQKLKASVLFSDDRALLMKLFSRNKTLRLLLPAFLALILPQSQRLVFFDFVCFAAEQSS